YYILTAIIIIALSIYLTAPFIDHHQFVFLVFSAFTALILLKKIDLVINEKRAIRHELAAKNTELAREHQEQKELLKSVEYAKRQWEMTIDCMDDMLILTNAELIVQRCNNPVAEFTGLEYLSILGRNINQLYPELNIETRNLIAESFEYRHEASGRFFYVRIYGVEEGGRPMFVITLSDISEVKMINARLQLQNQEIKQERQQLQTALDKISQLIKLASTGKFIIEPLDDSQKSCYDELECTNPECPCYGVKKARCWLISGTLCLCHGEQQDDFASKKELCAKCPYYKKRVQDPISQVNEEFNSLMHMLVSKNRELARAYEELKEAESQMLQQEKMASIGLLAAGVAHEINNPVAFIGSNINTMKKYMLRISTFITTLEEYLQESGQAAAAAESRRSLKIDFIMADINDLINESLDGCERVKKIVMDLKGFSRVDDSDRQAADINECLDTTINMVWNELKYKVDLKKDYDENLPLLDCYPQQLNQVFMNLLVNAAHSIADRGEIHLKTWAEADSIYVKISDTGAGIAPEHLSHIFEPFFTTKKVGEGTGLGLSIVYDIITKNHKGDIEVNSEIGGGTTFIIELPCNTSGNIPESS
ncbi:MAG TPA: PAS domain-containing sensor histidine kinase, partial [Desulfobacterales bacterium]|nr:PAS domain-containing sensor histidine kinase [Desulfobacterales bacterium]